MKRLILVFAILAFFSCKKKAEPTPVTVDNTDYADSLVGTYKGQQTIYQSDNSTQFSNNTTATVTVTKISKNVVAVHWDGGGGGYFDLTSDNHAPDWNVRMTPETYKAYTAYAGYNTYAYSSKTLTVYVKDGQPLYYYFVGIKQ